ncbi:MAG: D-alanine--D-alanine ligase [Myxococcales bacterium]|nr:D-alanine--D-alanine ligase [Myxococcales bacterium]MCB9708598.1 D-alanine--D-alanine ligase [Myxococcales bacterium]
MTKYREKRVGVLMGGLSAEREISLKTGECVHRALVSRGYDAVTVFVDRDIDKVLRQDPIDVAFIALHGTYGEDGCIQGLLELLGIPYTGSGVLASALAMDKVKAKELFRLYNVPTPPYYVLEPDTLEEAEQAHGSFGFPVFIKPRSQGSSVGSSKAASLTELHAGVKLASQFPGDVLVERYIQGQEIQVGLLHGKPLGAIEIEPLGEFYDYQAKYQAGQSTYHFPARVSPSRYQTLLDVAEKANRSVGAIGATRVDMMVTEGGNDYVLEVNTLPGLTSSASLLPKIVRGLGYTFEDLCVAILEGIPLSAVAPAVKPIPVGLASTPSAA